MKIISNQITRRQHYVWQYYLKSWTLNNKTWVKRGNKIFNTSTKNIMVKKDFYKVHKLNSYEKHIRDTILSEDKRQDVHQIIKYDNSNLDFIELFDFDVFSPWEAILILIEQLNAKIMVDDNEIDFVNLIESSTQETKEKIDNILKKDFKNFRIQKGEDLISFDENEGKIYLDKLLDDDISFLGEQKELFYFFYFVVFKFMRTNKIKNIFVKMIENIIETTKVLFPNQEASAEKIFSHYFYTLTTKLSFDIFSSGDYKTILMRSKNNNFITSDQPVFNINDEIDKNGYDIDMDFYMPISPKRAVLISKKNKRNTIVDVDDVKVEFLNNKVIENSHDTIVGINREDLY